jgi:hypothetical protein
MNAERRQQRRAQRDEDRAQAKRDKNADGEDLLLVLGRHRKRGHDHDEYEEVVDREALLDHVAGEVLRPEIPPGDGGEEQAEPDGDGDVERRPGRRFAKADGVGAPAGNQEVDGQQRDHEPDCRRPTCGRHVEHGRGSGLDQAAPDRVPGELHPVAHAELRHDVLAVALDRLGLITSSSAISSLLCASATSFTTSSSRGVSGSSWTSSPSAARSR